MFPDGEQPRSPARSRNRFAQARGAEIQAEYVEVETGTYLTWTEDNLLRQVLYQAHREDKPAHQVVRAASAAPQALAEPVDRPGVY